MRQRIRQYGVVLCVGIGVATLLPRPAPARTTGVAIGTAIGVATLRADEEYDTYRRKGDELFKAGRYAEARRQYQNCLEVPGFENDDWAKRRIELATQCLAWLQQVDEAVQRQDDTLVTNVLRRVLALNPTDGLVLVRLAEHYEAKGNELNGTNRPADAKAQYLQALDYARVSGNRLKINALETQVKAINARLDERETEQEIKFRPAGPTMQERSVARPAQQRNVPRLSLPKVGLGVLALSAGYAAYSLNRDFREKSENVERLGREYDPDNDGIINNPDQYNQYTEARAAAAAAQERQGVYKVCVGVAAVALVADVYLFVRKPKPRPIGLFWQPARLSYGLTVGYQF